MQGHSTPRLLWTIATIMVVFCISFRLQAQVVASGELDQLVKVNSDAGNFSIPYGYFAGRPPIGLAEKTKHWDFFSIAFWMPSGRYIDKDIFRQPVGRPVQADISPGSYAVIVALVKPITAKDTTDPKVQLENFITPSSDFEYKRVGDFLEARSHYIQNVGLDIYFGAKYEQNGVTSMLLNCFDYEQPVRPPLCSGTVQTTALSIRYTMQIDSGHLNDAYPAAIEAHNLLSHWKSGTDP